MAAGSGGGIARSYLAIVCHAGRAEDDRLLGEAPALLTRSLRMAAVERRCRSRQHDRPGSHLLGLQTRFRCFVQFGTNARGRETFVAPRPAMALLDMTLLVIPAGSGGESREELRGPGICNLHCGLRLRGWHRASATASFCKRIGGRPASNCRRRRSCFHGRRRLRRERFVTNEMQRPGNPVC